MRVIIAILLILIATPLHADTAIEVGQLFDSNRQLADAVFVHEIIADKYAIGLGFTTEFEGWGGTWDSEALIEVMRYHQFGPVTFGWGATWWHHENPFIDDSMYFTESVIFNMPSGFQLAWRHWSTGGAGFGGFDSMTVGWKFK